MLAAAAPSTLIVMVWEEWTIRRLEADEAVRRSHAESVARRRRVDELESPAQGRADDSSPSYDYYDDDGTLIRVPRTSIGTDVLRDGEWQPIDPEIYGVTMPWAVKIGMGEVEYLGTVDPLEGQSRPRK